MWEGIRGDEGFKRWASVSNEGEHNDFRGNDESLIEYKEDVDGVRGCDNTSVIA